MGLEYTEASQNSTNQTVVNKEAKFEQLLASGKSSSGENS